MNYAPHVTAALPKAKEAIAKYGAVASPPAGKPSPQGEKPANKLPQAKPVVKPVRKPEEFSSQFDTSQRMNVSRAEEGGKLVDEAAKALTAVQFKQFAAQMGHPAVHGSKGQMAEQVKQLLQRQAVTESQVNRIGQKDNPAAQPASREAQISKLDNAVQEYNKDPARGRAAGMKETPDYADYKLPQGGDAQQKTEASVAASLEGSSAGNPTTIRQAYDKAKETVPNLTVEQFHGVLGRMANAKQIQLRPYTSAYATIPDPGHVMPLDGELINYIRPK